MIGGLSLRTKGVYFIMATLAFNQMIYFLFNALEIYGGDDGVGLFAARRVIGPLDASDDIVFFYVCFAVLVVFAVILNLVGQITVRSGGEGLPQQHGPYGRARLPDPTGTGLPPSPCPPPSPRWPGPWP